MVDPIRQHGGEIGLDDIIIIEDYVLGKGVNLSWTAIE